MLKLHKLFSLPLLKINITNLIQKVLFDFRKKQNIVKVKKPYLR